MVTLLLIASWIEDDWGADMYSAPELLGISRAARVFASRPGASHQAKIPFQSCARQRLVDCHTEDTCTMQLQMAVPILIWSQFDLVQCLRLTSRTQETATLCNTRKALSSSLLRRDLDCNFSTSIELFQVLVPRIWSKLFKHCTGASWREAAHASNMTRFMGSSTAWWPVQAQGSLACSISASISCMNCAHTWMWQWLN